MIKKVLLSWNQATEYFTGEKTKAGTLKALPGNLNPTVFSPEPFCHTWGII